MDDIFNPNYFEIDDTYDTATEGAITDYFKKRSAERKAAIRQQRVSTVRASKMQFSSMSESERDAAWAKMIRLLTMYGCVPSNVTVKNARITEYDLYGTSIFGYSLRYEKGIQYIHIAANQQFTNSDDMVSYMKMYIDHDIEEERRKEEQRRRQMEEASKRTEQYAKELREKEYLEQMKRANNANIAYMNAQTNVANARAYDIQSQTRQREYERRHGY